MPVLWGERGSSKAKETRLSGIGSIMTTLHIDFERDIAQVLELPAGVTQAALVAAGYFTGSDFKPAKRAPVRS